MKKHEIYQFKNPENEQSALIHPSKIKNSFFQRLEFLGDRLVSEVLAKWIMENSTFSEKKMSIWMNNIISAKTMSEIGQFLVEHMSYTGKLQENIICDTLEAWIGAVYIDGGDYRSIILKLWQDYLHKDYLSCWKNQLQEYCHKKNLSFDLQYKVDNELNHICYATSNDKLVKSLGKSKKQASQQACEKLLKILKSKK